MSQDISGYMDTVQNTLEKNNDTSKSESQDLQERQSVIREYVERVWPELLVDLKKLVAIPSVYDDDKETRIGPFGVGPLQALHLGCKIGRKLGISMVNEEDHIAFGDVPGESDAQIALLAHLDVVPAGDGWESDPYELTRREKYLVGRGVIDDKGPAVLALYTAHYFVERAQKTGKSLPYTLRIILGSNEETGFEDVYYYLDHHEPPAFLISPDSDWPVCIGEKGILRGDFMTPPIQDGRIISLEAGEAINMVPNRAVAVVVADASDLPELEGIRIIDAGLNKTKIVALGRGGHASTPNDYDNPIGTLTKYLLENNICNAQEKRFLEFEQCLFSDVEASGIGLDHADELFGPLTCAGTIVKSREGRLIQCVDVRFPPSVTQDQLKQEMQEIAQRFGLESVAYRADDPYYVDKDAPAIKLLSKVYEEHTGLSGAPYTMGGGTYARCFPHAVSYGPDPSENEGGPAWVGSVHSANEAFLEEHLKQSLAIYIDAIDRLMDLDWK